jgi:hypothetical protein
MAFGRDANVRWIRAEESENVSAMLDTIPNMGPGAIVGLSAGSLQAARPPGPASEAAGRCGPGPATPRARRRSLPVSLGPRLDGPRSRFRRVKSTDRSSRRLPLPSQCVQHLANDSDCGDALTGRRLGACTCCRRGLSASASCRSRNRYSVAKCLVTHAMRIASCFGPARAAGPGPGSPDLGCHESCHRAGPGGGESGTRRERWGLH